MIAVEAPAPLMLSTALDYADKIAEWLAPFCEKIEIAGSIRRQRHFVNDIDLVVIPRRIPGEADLLGHRTPSTNACAAELLRYVQENRDRGAAWRTMHGTAPEPNADIFLLQLPKCALDVFMATPETWITRLMCRTGSKEHNIWIAQRAKQFGMKWDPFIGLLAGGRWNADQTIYACGKPVATHTEEEFYQALQLPFIPRNRRDPEFLPR